ncbi:neuroligin-4 Y-linked, partial [Biomphalaria pfeifferi]
SEFDDHGIVGYLQPAEASVYITTTATAQTKTAYTGIAYNASFSTTSYVVAQFLGIPYAQPPTGSKRFAKPVINTPAVGSYDASKLGNICPQHSNSGDQCISRLAPSMNEDCLYLNIYVPLPNTTASDVESGVNRTLPTGKQYPVFFYIHGGDYYLRSGNCYNGTNLAGLGEVIVVISNYRLGILGFMATGDDVISGNLALWDQWTALRTALAHVLGPIIDSAGTGGKTFMYKFSKAYTNAEAKMLFNFFEGTEHDADIPNVFGFVSGSDNIALSKTFMSYAINFIKTGDPNGPGLAQWKEFNAETQPYMYISANTVEQREYFGASIQQFWNELIPSLKQCKGSSSTADCLQNTVLVPMVTVAWSIYRFVVCINYN